MKEDLKLNDFRNIFLAGRETLTANRNYLCELDSVIGDGDHGITISSGFEKIVKTIEGRDFTDSAELLKAAGASFMSTVGGTTGPIFGYLFIEMGNKLKEISKGETITVGTDEFYIMAEAAMEKIMKLGGAKPGDKTMIDALYPAVNSLQQSVKERLALGQAFSLMAEAALSGAQSTKNLIAGKGRARYAGERAIGYQDAGATSLYLILNEFNKYVNSFYS
ncbi:MAG: dihydroxyacetone kinase subunit L [Dehalococcoidia bacterium]|nr:dihydroxyacetone kinase subunit L [Dehalococcoidia bacterium]